MSLWFQGSVKYKPADFSLEEHPTEGLAPQPLQHNQLINLTT
jgi:hypothetical protein